MKIEIRNARNQDIPRIAEIEAICFPPAEAAEPKSIEERIGAFPESFFVAENEDGIIGFINGCVTNGETIHDDLFHSTELHDPKGATQTVFGLDVLPQYRCQGIAGQLMNRLIDAAREAGRERVILTCKEHLVHYYESFGYENRGVSQSTHGGAVWYDMTLTF